MAKLQISRWFNRLDSRAAWQFLGILYIARWALIIPYMIAGRFLFTEGQLSAASASKLSGINPVLLFSNIVVLGPLLETLFECSLPFYILSLIHKQKGKLPKHSWSFVIISAMLMVLSHPMLAAIIPSFITGFCLAYCYAHFAFRGFGYAIMYTAGFHAAINIIGWTLIVFGSNT